jgi:glycosyltransferase involved in cell wall biosynthesis
LAELARELVRHGSEVTVLTARWDTAWPCEELVEQVRIVRLARSHLRFWGTWRFISSLRGWLLEHGRAAELWYVSMLKHCAWVALGAKAQCGVPVVLRPEGSGPTGDVAWQERALGGKLIRKRCRGAEAVLALTPHMRAELEQAGFRSNQIRDIPNGVPIPPLEDDLERKAWRQRLGLELEAPLAVFVGRLSSEKGVDDLISAWKTVHAELPQAVLAIVGSGVEQNRLRALARGQEKILWFGATREPQRYLRAADLFVLPSHEEGMSISLLEAMSLALPIVASDIPGNRALIDSGRHGLLVAPRKPALLAKSLLLQLRARTVAAAMGRAARERVEEAFSITQVAQRHLELFEELVRAKR